MRLLLKWEVVVNIPSTLILSSAEDELIWCFHSTGFNFFFGSSKKISCSLETI
jgi:hypothetical protein